jgi:Delta3-Delta2-enoyl-CoA isomerase
MLERHDHPDAIVELRLARPPVNALNPELLDALCTALERAVADDARGLVLSGSPGIFSAGLDVPRLLTLDRAALKDAWQRFFDVCTRLATSPMPCVAALTGHSPAGGAVLGLYCDYRVMAEGDFRIGLNEVQVGLVVPDCIQHALRRTVGPLRAERLMVSGAMVDAAEALRVGMVDELAAPDAVITRSIEWLKALLALPRSAMLRTRELSRADLVSAIRDPEKLRLDGFLDAWFGTETQGVLTAMVARLKSKG